ncbi:MAG: preprotein translocase subunit SecG [Planctomycetia bacterium]|jgi:preprotein translocase subunit SecG|nr:preprotein translocase subunit SecG [Planctomycetia bacterium]
MFELVRFLLGFMLVVTSLFLILLVLIQRGRGGGLAGALGGMGGQSAFGTKAGDMFTRITVGVAAFWIVLCILSINVLSRQRPLLRQNLGVAAPQAVDASSETNADPSKPPIPDTPESTVPAVPDGSSPVAPEESSTTPPAESPAPAAQSSSETVPDAPKE